jgi:hypothetical protein
MRGIHPFSHLSVQSMLKFERGSLRACQMVPPKSLGLDGRLAPVSLEPRMNGVWSSPPFCVKGGWGNDTKTSVGGPPDASLRCLQGIP